MADNPIAIDKDTTPKIHPTKETIRHLRHQIEERKPEVKRKIFDKSGTTPTERELINAAGDQLRRELESDYDVMTGLLNTRGYDKQRKEAIKTAKDQDLPVAVAVIDLDNLKKMNDNNGHEAGDKYIKTAADVLKKISRETDLAARTGGDEFQVFLVNTTQELADAWKRRAVAEMKARNVNASIGLSPVNLENVEESIRTADTQMYSEKRIKKEQQENKSPKIIRLVRNIWKRAA